MRGGVGPWAVAAPGGAVVCPRLACGRLGLAPGAEVSVALSQQRFLGRACRWPQVGSWAQPAGVCRGPVRWGHRRASQLVEALDARPGAAKHVPGESWAGKEGSSLLHRVSTCVVPGSRAPLGHGAILIRVSWCALSLHILPEQLIEFSGFLPQTPAQSLRLGPQPLLRIPACYGPQHLLGQGPVSPGQAGCAWPAPRALLCCTACIPGHGALERPAHPATWVGAPGAESSLSGL